MHPFDSVLDAMDVESSLYVRIRARAPWGIGFNSGCQARLLVVASGTAWFTRAGQPPLQLHPGDCLIIKKGTDCAIADMPDGDLTPCSQVTDRVTGDAVEFGGAGAACEFISARMTFDHTAGEPLLALLPEVVHVPLGEGGSGRLLATFDLIGREEAERGLGADFVIGRLVDTLFIQVVRAWTKAEGNIPSGWLAGLSHHRLAGTLGLIHNDLTKPWTIEMLARSAAMSRSAFAVLFKSVVGVSPLAYIAGWRIYRAKMLLAGGHSIAKAAELCGYGSDIALSRAFRAATGLSPGQWRARYRADADSGSRFEARNRPVEREHAS
ncbi:AraC family transcriptional regulator [Xanthobacter sp. VNH20]|uniref:AraC family transcriptional regulator n=1 Tax=Xanthobacter sp. VNH20 TaxID=3156616 RepID=UPI0032B61AFF